MGWRANILVVDDDPRELGAIGDALEPLGYDVVLCENPLIATGLCQALAPDLVLTDFKMPERNGIEVVRELRADGQFSRLPVVLMAPDQEIAEAAVEAGATEALTKPFDVQALTACLDRLLEAS